MEIKYLIIHHSAISRAKNSEQFDAINNYHKRKGWGMIGYHFLIEPNGRIRVGRLENQIGAHCIGRNHDSLGICLTGNFDIEDPTKEQEKSLKILLSDLLKEYPKAQIKYHRNFANKSCPGKLIADNWAKNLIVNTNDMLKIIGDKRDKKQYLLGEDKVIDWIVNSNTLEKLHSRGIVNKNEVEWKDNLDGYIMGGIIILA